MEPAEKNATCLSRILFSWVDPLLRRGYASPLQMEHIWPLQPRESAVELRARFFAHTDSAADDGAIDADGDGATMDDVVSCGQFVQNVFRAEANTLLRSAAFSGVHMLSQCATPMLLKVLVESIYHGALLDASLPWYARGAGLCYAAAMALNIVFGLVFNQQAKHAVFRVGQRVRAVAIALVYRRAVRLAGPVALSTSNGETVNLVASDAQKFFDVFPQINLLWTAPIQIVLTLALLVYTVGAAAFVGMLVLLLLIPLNMAIAKWSARLRQRHLVVSDERVRVCSEVVVGMRGVKLNGWATPFEEKVAALRAKEMVYVHAELQTFAFQIFLMIMNPQFAILATFAVRALLGSRMAAADAFATMGECYFMYRYILRESCSQFDSPPLTSLTIHSPKDSSTSFASRSCTSGKSSRSAFRRSSRRNASRPSSPKRAWWWRRTARHARRRCWRRRPMPTCSSRSTARRLRGAAPRPPTPRRATRARRGVRRTPPLRAPLRSPPPPAPPSRMRGKRRTPPCRSAR